MTQPQGSASSSAATGEQGRPWWKSAVVYQVYPRSFSDSNGDGIGDIPGITARLDHLAALGVDVLWLSPAYASPQDDNGYDISDYQAIDPTFGTLEDMDELIAQAGARGIRIVMDLVVNHTSDEHAWFEESRSSKDNPKRDWYWWRPARAGHEAGTPGAEPTNWGSFFSGSAWKLDDQTGEYYLHLFSRKQPDLNWENPQVRAAVYAMMRWWLERGVAGFRMDVINLISKQVGSNGELADGAPRADGWGNGFPQYVDGPRIHEFLAEMHREVFDAYPDTTFFTVGETPGTTLEQARLYSAPGRRELNMVFQFEHVDIDHGPGGKFDPQPLDLPALKANLARWQEGLAGTGWGSLYWNNHDQPRIVSRWGDEAHRVASAKTLGTVLHLMQGTPFVYQGEELGMTNAHFTDLDQYRDLEALNYAEDAERLGIDHATLISGLAANSRDNARTPVAWDTSPHAGFTTGEPWIGMTPGWEQINAQVALADPDSVFHHYRRLIALRHGESIEGFDGDVSPLVIDGTFALLAQEHPALWAYTRTLGDRHLLVAANCSSEALEVDLIDDLDGVPRWSRAGVILASHPEPATPDGAGHLILRPWESVVVLAE